MVLFPAIRELRGYVKIKPTTRIDNIPFQLHYKLVFGIIVLSVLLLAKGTYFGQPIDCHFHGSVTPNLINNYCWLNGTYTIENALGQVVGVEIIAPGVKIVQPGDRIIRHKYYQWVVFVLGLQAAAFYITH